MEGHHKARQTTDQIQNGSYFINRGLPFLMFPATIDFRRCRPYVNIRPMMNPSRAAQTLTQVLILGLQPSTIECKGAKKRIAIVGASLVRDLGPLVHSYDTDACSYPNPGCTTQYSTDRLESLTDESDDVIVIQSAVNNIPKDSVAQTIQDVGKLIDKTIKIRPHSEVILAEVPPR